MLSSPRRDDRESAVTASCLTDEIQVHRTHVLVVENNPSICDMLYWLFELAGYRATTCTETEIWRDDVLHADIPPALVLLDISNPSLDASAFLRDLRLQWKTPLPILIMTTSKHIYEQVVAVEPIMLKPFHIRDLLGEVEKMLPRKGEGGISSSANSC